MMTGEIKDKLINVELTEYEASTFIEYQKHRKDFLALIQGGVFSIRNGQAILHFDSGGTLTEVDFNIIGFKRGHPIVQVVSFV